MVAPLVLKETYVTRRALVNGLEQEVYSYYRTGYNQKPPFVNTTLHLVLTTSENTSTGSMFIPTKDPTFVEATNKARSRFVDKLGTSSSFGATLTAELRKTWGTTVDGVTRMYLAARAVRKGNLPMAAEHLGIAPPVVSTRHVMKRTRIKGGKFRKKIVTRSFWVMPGGKYVAKSSANKWLWYSYAIKPLVSDIHNGMAVLTRPAPSGTKIRASSTVERLSDKTTDWGLRQLYTSRVRVMISASVSVRNPNLWLANQLGFVNPVQMFNEGIPFSFVFDWFSNLSQVISQLTDFVGLDIAEPVTSAKQLHLAQHIDTWRPNEPILTNKLELYDRSLEIPLAKLRFAYERFEWQRGLNAISLLVGFLRDSKR